MVSWSSAGSTAPCPWTRSSATATRVVEQVGRYLGFRARHFEAGAEQGASLKALAEMARFNTAQTLGEEAACDLDPLLRDAGLLEGAVRRVETDNRLHAWEWLHAPDGRLLKTDALDHHAGHDLIGCQDIAWDIAGATVELDLSEFGVPAAVPDRRRAVRTSRDPDLLALLTPCYLAFQMADHAMAANSGRTRKRGSPAAPRRHRPLRQAAGTDHSRRPPRPLADGHLHRRGLG